MLFVFKLSSSFTKDYNCCFFLIRVILSMIPTYSVYEIKNLVRSFDIAETNILDELVSEEASGYAPYELRAIARMIALRKKAISHNEVKLEFLLAYN